MLDHLGLPVRDIAASAAFYDAVLAPLGGRRILDYGEAIGYGVDQPMFWLARADPPIPGPQIHVAFTAPDRATVVRFFEVAMAAGAEVLHAPRLWPEYHQAYFAAFVRDPDGNNVEAVSHRRE